PGDRHALRIDEVPVLGDGVLRAARRVDPDDPSVAVECLAVDDQDLPGGVDRDAGGKGQKASGRDDTRLPGPGVDLDDGLLAEIGDQDVPRIERAGEASTGRQDENADEYADSRRVRNARHPLSPSLVVHWLPLRPHGRAANVPAETRRPSQIHPTTRERGGTHLRGAKVPFG